MQTIPSRAARDTIRAVFDQRAYDRSVVHSLWDRLWDVFMRWVDGLFRAVGHSSVAHVLSIVLVVILLGLIAARIALGILAGDASLARIGGPRAGLGESSDPWVVAQRLAAAGQFTEAAHALYASVLRGLAARNQVRVHPSKTVGDYARELRRRSSALVSPFREFARSYEVVIYGLGYCDRERYDRLYALARSMIPARP